MRSTKLRVIPDGYISFTREFFVSSHNFDTPDVFCNYMYAWYFFFVWHREGTRC
jgi:hypothetical protein